MILLYYQPRRRTTMANMIITQDIENILKRKYAELNKVTPKTWKSSEFLAWRHKEIDKLNQKFNDFLNKKGPQEASFYENMNPVYQNNVNKDFQQKEGLKQNSGKRIQNRFGLAMTEAENENRQTNFGQAYERLGIVGKVQSGLYKFSHLVQSSGIKLAKFGAKLAKNTKYMPASQLAGVTCMALGAELAVGGTIMKAMANPEYLLTPFKRKNNTANAGSTSISAGRSTDKETNAPQKARCQVNLRALRGLESETKAPAVASPRSHANIQTIAALHNRTIQH